MTVIFGAFVAGVTHMLVFWIITPCGVQMEGAHSSETWNAHIIRHSIKAQKTII
jgi:hypothetical protein